MKFLAGFAFNQGATDHFPLIPNTERHWDHCTSGIVSHNSNNSTLPIFTNRCFGIVTKWVVDVILLQQIGLKCFSMRMTLALMFFAAPHRLTRPGFRGAPRGRTPFHPKGVISTGPHPLPANTFSVTTVTDSHTRARGPQHLSCVGLTCTLSRLRAERSTTGRWPSRWRPRSRLRGTIPTLDRDAGRPLEPWVCHHTREPTVLSRVSCRSFHLKFDRFSPALPVNWAHFQDRWELSSPYHVADTYPFWAARLFLLCVSLEVFCHAHWTVPRQHVNSSFPLPPPLPRCHPLVLGVHTRGFGDPRESAATCWRPALGPPFSWPSSFMSSRTRKFSACFTTMWQSGHSEVNVHFLELSEQTGWFVHSQVSPFLFDLRLRFRLRLCLYLHVQQTLAHNSGWMTMHPQVSPFLSLCFRSQARYLFRSPW